MLQHLPIPTEIIHIKSHQEKHKQWDELNNFAQINILTDHQAKKSMIFGQYKLDSSPLGSLAHMLPSSMATNNSLKVSHPSISEMQNTPTTRRKISSYARKWHWTHMTVG
jgi:hypothetical protein